MKRSVFQAKKVSDMSFDNNSFYDDNSTKNWQPQPTPMEDRRRRHTGRWITAIVILAAGADRRRDGASGTGRGRDA